MKRLSRTYALGFICLLSVLTSQAYAQYDAVPQVAVSTDKAVYSQFEPVQVSIRLENTSASVQEYGLVGWPVPNSAIGYQVVDPTGVALLPYRMYETIDVWPYQEVLYEPGQQRTATFNLLIGYPITEQVGPYVLEVLFYEDPFSAESPVTPVASVTFDIQAPPGVNQDTAETLNEAVQAIFGLEAFAPGYEGAVQQDLEDILSNESIPAYMMELARYLQAVYAEFDVRFGTGSSGLNAEQLYADFLTDYPESVYATAAQYGAFSLITYGGSLPSDFDADPPDNGSCLQIPVNADITFATTSVWGTGYNAEITLTNTGTEAIRGWQLSFDLAADITSLWNGQLTSDGLQRTVTDAGHNGVIAPGQSITFGFQVQSGTVVEPASYSLNPDQCDGGGPSVDIAFATTSVWGTGYNAEITLTNTGTEAIRGWQLSFDLAPEVTSLWNGQLTSEGPRRTVTDAGHNGVIAPGQSITFGFQVQSGSVVEPSDYDFAFWVLGPPQ